MAWSGRNTNRTQVAHVWAQQTKERGKAGNIFFEGATIYSYGHHFAMARFVPNKRGERAVLFTTRGYSNTTSQHLSAVRQAIYGLGLPVFHVHDPSETPGPKAKADYKARSDSQFELALKARGRAVYHAGVAAEIAKEANEFSKFFGLRWKLPIPELSQEAKDKHREAAKRAAAAVIRREGQRQRLALQALAFWESGATSLPEESPLRHARILPTDPTYLRVHGDSVETSRGAKVPIEHAKWLWPLILRQQEKGEAYVRNGHTIHVGEFAIERIEANGDIKAGCHFIKFDQIQKIARDLGLLPARA